MFNLRVSLALSVILHQINMNIKLNLNTIAITIIGSLTIYKIVLEVHSITPRYYFFPLVLFFRKQLFEGRGETQYISCRLHCQYRHYLQKRDVFNSQEIENLKNREAQHLIQWNLLMAEKESELSSLAAHQMDRAELDLLAESECGLAEITRDINNTTQQIKVNTTGLPYLDEY